MRTGAAGRKAPLLPLTPEGISGEGRDSSEKLTWSSRQTNLGSRQSNLGSGERKTHTDSVWTEPTTVPGFESLPPATPRGLQQVSSATPDPNCHPRK
ncbi:hypothetical protein MTO96_023065 [Rhipicephalus appendiculatus]